MDSIFFQRSIVMSLRVNVTVLMCVASSLLLTFLSTPVTGEVPMFHEELQAIEKIAKDAASPENREPAVRELMGIVTDSAKHARLRAAAAAKLGELGASESAQQLQSLANSLGWDDSTRELKRSTTLAYWQIRVHDEPDREAQNTLLVSLLSGKRHPPPHADVVALWAIDELANRGAQKALPDMIEQIRSCYGKSKYADKKIWLCTTKLNLLSSTENRPEALARALAMDDPTQDQWLKHWAIEELGSLATQECLGILIGYARELQNKHQNKNGEWKGATEDPFTSYATILYMRIIDILESNHMTETQIEQAGLRATGSAFLR
jgi:hypothetical protein